jgi:UDP-N-acetylglucosamine--N-acetylmuramyl-(pentapeptide) pyrophosphoryl-undecaprenol N-acetylglucosamine transferase
MIRRVIVAGGGTGGHLFPGVAIVEELRRRDRRTEVLWVGTPRGIESRVLPAMGEKLELLDVTPLKGQGPLDVAKSLGRLPVAVTHGYGILKQFMPDLVLGVGGYASGPILAASAAKGIPTALHEQNAHVGLTNRILARLVDRAYLSYPETADQFPDGKVRVVGNPVRRAFVQAARRAVSDPVGFEARSRTILVIGGSQGARALNQVVPEAIARAGIDQRHLRVVHQTGKAMRDEVAATYRQRGGDAEVVSFIDDMAKAYADAAIVIGRAGATTLAELCAIGRPSILIPFPAAADDHQARNAESLAADGASICIREAALSPGLLADTLRGLLDDAEARRLMSECARGRGRPDAAAAIVDDLYAWLGDGSEGVDVTPDEIEAATSDAPEKSEHKSAAANGAVLRGSRPYVPRWQRRTPSAPMASRRPLTIDGLTFES